MFYYKLNSVQNTLYIDFFSFRIVSETVEIQLSAVHYGVQYSTQCSLNTAHFGKCKICILYCSLNTFKY